VWTQCPIDYITLRSPVHLDIVENGEQASALLMPLYDGSVT